MYRHRHKRVVTREYTNGAEINNIVEINEKLTSLSTVFLFRTHPEQPETEQCSFEEVKTLG